MRRAVLPVLLAMSLIANAVLLLREPRTCAITAAVPVRTVAAARNADVTTTTPPARDVPALAAAPTPTRGPVTDAPPVLSPEDFDKLEGGPEAQERVTPFLADVFADARGGVAYDIACRGSVCQLEVVTPANGTGAFDWEHRIQAKAGSRFSGMAFVSGEPGQDPVSKEAIFTQRAYLTLADADAADGMPVLQSLWQRVLDSPALAACRRESPDAGTLDVKLQLDGSTGRIDTTLGGTLAIEPAGTCVKAVMDRAIADTAIPDRVLGAVLYERVDVP